MKELTLDSQAPDFLLKDTYGKEIRISDFRGMKNVALIFNRGFI